MAVDVIGWESLLERIRGSSLADAAYLTLTERRGGSEPQIQRLDIQAPTGPDDVFTQPVEAQVFELCDELRSIAIDQTVAGPASHYRISVYGPKGVRIVGAAFSTQQPDLYGGSTDAINSAAAVTGVNNYLVASFELGQRANRDAVEQLRELVRTLQARVRELELRNMELVNRLADERQADAENAGAVLRMKEGRVMFEQFIGSLKELGTAYILKEAPELAGLDPAMLNSLRSVLDDPELAQNIKDPALQKALQNPEFRRDFAGVLKSVADGAREYQAALPTSSTPPT